MSEHFGFFVVFIPASRVGKALIVGSSYGHQVSAEKEK